LQGPGGELDQGPGGTGFLPGTVATLQGLWHSLGYQGRSMDFETLREGAAAESQAPTGRCEIFREEMLPPVLARLGQGCPVAKW